MSEEPATYTAQHVVDLREELGCSLQEAKRILDKGTLIMQITHAKSVEDLKPILLKLLDMCNETICG